MLDKILDRDSTGFIKHFVRAYPWRTTAMVALLILSGLAEGIGIAALLPVLEVAVGDATGDDPVTRFLGLVGLEPTLVTLLSTIVLAILLKGCFRWLAMQQVGYSLARIAKDLRLRLVRALMAVRWTYFTGQQAGHFPNAVSTETYRASTAYRRACSALAGSIQVLVYAGIIVAISWEIALFSLVVGGLVALVMSVFVRMSRRAGGEQTTVMRSLTARLTDALQGIKSIKAMGREEHFLTLLEEEAEELQRTEQRQVLAQESLNSFQEPIITLVIAAGLYAALTWGNMTFSSILVIAFLFHRLTGRFHYVQGEYQGLAAGESAFWFLDETIRLAEVQAEPQSGRRAPPPLERELRVDRVSFAYGSEPPVLEDLSLRIPAGSFAALVGPSGAGKTTAVDLIIGLHRPREGEVYVDDVPLGEVDLTRWRRLIGYVPQDTLLFHDTVARNVTLGNERAGPERVEAALRQADAWEFVSGLPEGIDTVVGERGTRISGGQRQRIAIARALIGRPRLLILDEATTALDPATEAAICRTLARLRGEVTVIAISHQRAMQGVADVIFELRDGGASVLERREGRLDADSGVGEPRPA